MHLRWRNPCNWKLDLFRLSSLVLASEWSWNRKLFVVLLGMTKCMHRTTSYALGKIQYRTNGNYRTLLSMFPFGVTTVKTYRSAVPHENSAFKKSPSGFRSCVVDIFQWFDIYYKVSSEYGILSHKTRSWNGLFPSEASLSRHPLLKIWPFWRVKTTTRTSTKLHRVKSRWSTYLGSYIVW